MMPRGTAPALLALLVVAPCEARAQAAPSGLTLSTSLGIWRYPGQPARGGWSTGLSLERPTLRASLLSRIQPNLDGTIRLDGMAAVGGSLALGRSLRLAGDLAFGADRQAARYVSGFALSRVRLLAGGPDRGAYLGGGPVLSRSAAGWSGQPQAVAGLWFTRGVLTITASVTATRAGFPQGQEVFDSTSVGSDTLRSPVTSRSHFFQDAELGLGWHRGRIDLVARAGGRMGDATPGPSRWFNLTAAARVSSQVALVASGGSRPLDLATGVGGTGSFSLGIRYLLASDAEPVRVRPRAAGAAKAVLEAERAGTGVVVLRVRAPRARWVELAGDMTGWEPVLLEPAGPGVWETRLILSPGSYRCNLRVDGGRWMTPAGVVETEDEFGGVVGVIVVP